MNSDSNSGAKPYSFICSFQLKRVNWIKSFVILVLALPITALAAGRVLSIKTEGDVLIFSTTQHKPATVPGCVDANKSTLWAVSLLTPDGQAMQVMLSAALTANLNIAVASAGDCLDDSNIERVMSLTLLGAE